MMEGLVCWKCGASIAEHPLPLARAAECRSCRADLHVCKMCEHYDPRVAKSCREPIAEEVNDKERSNFCGYFKAKPGAYNATDHSVAAAAQAKLEALFGASPNGGQQGAASGAASSSQADSQGDQARRHLDRVFGLNDKHSKS